jgi:hypothetical protein
MVAIFKILLFIWPFIKEMVLGKKTMKEAIKDNKRKVAIAFVIVASLGLNMVTLTRLWTLSAQYVDLQKRYTFVDKKMTETTAAFNELRKKQGLPPTTPHDAVAQEVKPDSKPLPEPPKKPRSEKFAQPAAVDTQAAVRAKKLREHFDKIKKREETDGSV